jgi:hypothetical protein
MTTGSVRVEAGFAGALPLHAVVNTTARTGPAKVRAVLKMVVSFMDSLLNLINHYQ